MNKDAYYFPHFSNARLDRKIRRLRKELGMEGYGIYFCILEVLREQPNFSYPIKDADLLADDFNCSEEKVKTIITRYELFEITEDQFFSPKLIEYLDPYLKEKERKKIAGIIGNLIRYNHATKDQLKLMSNDEIIALNESILADSRTARPERSQILAKEKKRKEIKRKEIKENKRFIPTLSEVEDYFFKNGYTKQYAKKVFDYYQLSIENNPNAIYWKDGKGNSIKNWKMKVRIWMKDEGKMQVYNSNQPVSQAKNDGEVFTMPNDVALQLQAMQQKFKV